MKTRVGDRVEFRCACSLTPAGADPKVDRDAAFLRSVPPPNHFVAVAAGAKGTVVFIDPTIYWGSCVVYVALDDSTHIIKEYGRFSYKRLDR